MNFSDFWKLWPPRNGKKVGKQEAFNEWNRLSEDEKILCVQAILEQKKHAAHCKANGDFVAEFPDCFRWIKKRRFEDEVVLEEDAKVLFLRSVKK